jgi:hypothetical protein
MNNKCKLISIEKKLSQDILDELSMSMIVGGDTTKTDCSTVKTSCPITIKICDISIKWISCNEVPKDSTCTPPIPKDSTCGH